MLKHSKAPIKKLYKKIKLFNQNIEFKVAND
jgi:hypothetical protein